jgi:hypothetical protein
MKNGFISKSSLLLLCVLGLCSIMPHHAFAQDWKTWHYYADISVEPQADPSYDAVYAVFSRLLSHDLHQNGALDENSIRVAPVVDGKVGDAVPINFVKDNGFNETDNAAGTIVFLVAPSSKADEVTYRVFFDTKANGPKPAMKIDTEVPEPGSPLDLQNLPVPDAANMIWNGSFEILSDGYVGSNPNYNSGANMPRGWWGNLHNSKLTANAATSAHTGQHAFGYAVPADAGNVGIMSAPTPPGIRVLPGQSYQLSFWVKGDNLTSVYPLYAYVYWYDKDGKYLNRENISNLPPNKNQFDWTQVAINVKAPDNAGYSSMYVGTYSKTGVLTVVDFEARETIPPPLANAKLNQ